VRALGAAYLVWLGIRTLMEGRARALGVAEEADVRAFRQGVITEVVNPKTALFFVSFLFAR
jgi:threonine/homoserine/homoserine lactone efflux protein